MIRSLIRNARFVVKPEIGESRYWPIPLSSVSCGFSIFLLSVALRWQSALVRPLSDSDAALFANMARELSAAPIRTWMYMGGQWDWLFYEKPPLLLWIEAFSMRILGPVPQAAILPTLIASQLSLLLLYKIGKNLVDREFGFLAALILCLTPWFLKIGRTPIMEPMLMFFMALTLYWGMGLRRGMGYVRGSGWLWRLPS